MSDEDNSSLIPDTGDNPPAGDPPAGDPPSGDPPAGDPPTATFNLYGDDGVNAGLATAMGEGDELKATRGFFKKYADAENPQAEALKGVENLLYLVGQKERNRPADDATDAQKEEWGKYLQKINQTPENAEGYNFVRPADLAEDVPYSDEEAKAYSEILHKHNVSPDLAKDLHELYVSGLQGIPDQIGIEEKQHRDSQIQLLRDEHGVSAEKVIDQAKVTGKALGATSEMISHIAQTAEGVNWLAGLNNLISSDMLGIVKSGEGITGGTGTAWLERAEASTKLAYDAIKRNDTASYEKHNDDANAFRKRGTSS